jgi:uncharacterized membrane protein YadS
MSVNTQKQPQSRLMGTIIGIVIIAALALAVNWLSHNSAKFVGKDFSKALEYPLWAALLGLITNAIVTATNTKEMIKPAIRTELFLKTGLVLMGASVNLAVIVSVGGKGIIQGLIMITAVFFFTWWLCDRYGLPESLKAVMATAISVCGVSAAIAAAGSVLAKKEELAYVTALVIFTALPLMVLMPWLANVMGLPPEVAGAWFGGNIDTSAAVVGAGTIHGEATAKIAAVVKMTQNALIGFVAFALAFYFTVVVEKGTKPSASVIWERFPKFVLGFILTSIIASMGFFDKADLTAIKNLQQWAFNLAFVCIGLELTFADFKHIGGKPTVVFLIATFFNTVLALAVAYVLFGLLA